MYVNFLVPQTFADQQSASHRAAERYAVVTAAQERLRSSRTSTHAGSGRRWPASLVRWRS